MHHLLADALVEASHELKKKLSVRLTRPELELYHSLGRIGAAFA